MAYFVEDFDTQAKNAVLTIAREDYDSYDQWGWCINWLFDIAAEMELRELDNASLEYSSGAFGPEISEERAEFMHEFSDSALEYAAKILNRFDHYCRVKGLNY